MFLPIYAGSQATAVGRMSIAALVVVLALLGAALVAALASGPAKSVVGTALDAIDRIRS